MLVTSGFIQMPSLPAAQLPKLRVYAMNLENTSHQVTIDVYKLIGEERVGIEHRQLDVPGDDTVMIELETDVIEGQLIEVVAELPLSSFVANVAAVQPSVSVVTLFIGDGSTSALQYVSAGEFEPVGG